MEFKDLNFKICIVGALHDLGYYNEELENIKKDNLDWDEDYKPIPAVLEFYKNLKIDQKYLDEIEELQPDGGDLCYQYLFNVWDGEDDQCNIKSIEGIENLRNLKSFEPNSMINENGIDFTPILGCLKLENVAMEEWQSNSKKNEKVRERLKEREVDVY